MFFISVVSRVPFVRTRITTYLPPLFCRRYGKELLYADGSREKLEMRERPVKSAA